MLVADFEEVLERLAPKSLAEPGDNCGLLVGDEQARVKRVLLALEMTEEVCGEAVAGGYETVLTHHPLLFSPLCSLIESRPRERLVRRLVREGISLLACHTNLDAASGGLADIAGEALGLEGMIPLRRSAADWYKLVGFVPPEAVEEVAAAVFATGAGAIGDYTECAFTAEGRGWFTAGEGAHPAVGRVSVPERTPELRWETVVPRAQISAAIAAFVRSHPYEEPAFDVYPVEDVVLRAGLGRVGTLAVPVRVADLARRSVEVFGLSTCAWGGPSDRTVGRVGVVPGGGRSLVDDAVGMCEALITGDLGYHDAERANEAGLSLIEVAHGEFEWWAFQQWGLTLAGELAGSGVKVSVSRQWLLPWKQAGGDSAVGKSADQTSGGSATESAALAAKHKESGMRLWVDGGSRGNPGTSAIGVILEDMRGVVVAEVSRLIGVATNNVAEYRAFLVGLELAAHTGAREVDVFSDSELLVKQLRGEYRVKSDSLKALHEEARMLIDGFDRVSINHVGREENARADGLVNRALDEPAEL